MSISGGSDVLSDVQSQAGLVALRGLDKRFKSGTLALDNLDLTIYRGEFLSLLGPSGCGKSTVLRLIAGLEAPSRGTVTWRDPTAAKETSKDIGFVFQEPTLMPWASVFDNVYLPLRLQKQSRRAARSAIMAMLGLVGLASFAEAFPRELSGGMRMRVSIARALVLEPALLLMDEPFAALDEITRWRLNDDLLRLKQELGTTIVFVTHSVYESVYLSDRIAVLAARPGRLISEIEIAAPLPRGKDFRQSQIYEQGCAAAGAALEAAMHEEPAA